MSWQRLSRLCGERIESELEMWHGRLVTYTKGHLAPLHGSHDGEFEDLMDFRRIGGLKVFGGLW